MLQLLRRHNRNGPGELISVMNKQISIAAQWTLAGGLGLLLTNTPAAASGFSIPEFSALGTGMANAVVANPEEAGAFAYNPAAMGFHDTSSFAAGTVLINPTFDVRTASGGHSSDNADWFSAPILQGSLKLHDQWRLGFGITAPFGLETRWKLGTFPKLSGSFQVPTQLPPPFPASITVPSGAHPTTSSLEVVTVTPTLAYRIHDDLSLAFGLDYYKAREANLNTQITKLEGDGDALGWNANLLYRNGAWSLGASFHSAVTIDIDGWYTPLDPTLVQFGILKPEQSASVDLNLPWRLQLGVRYAISEPLAVELDWTRIGWSEFEKTEIIGSQDGLLISDVHEWKDANAYRLGVTYDIRPTTQLRFGYSYDETGQEDEHFSARVPDNDRHLFAIGVRQDLGKDWALEAAYMYVAVEERKIRSDRAYQQLGDEVNGSDAYDGDYDNSVNLLALEVRRTF